MTIRADNVAFRNFCHEARSRHEHRSAAHDIERLVRRITMVEVHHPGREVASAISARTTTHLPEEFQRGPLSAGYTRDLVSAVRDVVGDVVRALVSFAVHKHAVRTLFTPCQ